jgi:putative oxidoreductase
MNTSYTIRWAVTIFLGLVFAGSGAAKVLGDPVFSSWFREFGIPLGFMRALGVIELIGAYALCIPGLARYANLGFLCIAIGASVTHLAFGQPFAALLPTALASAAAVAVWGTPGHPVRAPDPKLLLGPDADTPADLDRGDLDGHHPLPTRAV